MIFTDLAKFSFGKLHGLAILRNLIIPFILKDIVLVFEYSKPEATTLSKFYQKELKKLEWS